MKEVGAPLEKAKRDRANRACLEVHAALRILEAQREVDEWISGFKEGYWRPLSMLARLVEEVGELSREVNHLYGEKPKKPGEAEGDLALEMGDILFILCAFANSLDIDLEQAFKDVMAKYRSRDKDRWTPKGS